jgi:acetyl esterase/lipase
MIMGDAWSVLPRILREWALPLELAVVSVEYRLAPRVQLPAPLEDCYAGLVWAAGHAAELGIDADRIVIGGKSAGGGLAAALALPARDRGGPGALGQLLLSPPPGAFHGFDSLAPRATLSQEARDTRTRWLRRLLS